LAAQPLILDEATRFAVSLVRPWPRSPKTKVISSKERISVGRCYVLGPVWDTGAGSALHQWKRRL